MSNEKEIINRNSRENSSDVVDKILKDVTRLYDEYAVMYLRRKIAIDAILCDQRSSDCNCVYFLKNKENGLVKIGSTKIFPKREKQISLIYKSYGGKVDILEPMLIIKTGGIEPRNVEFNLHRVFSEKRMYGEWFSLDDEDFENVIYNYTTGTDMVNGICTGELYVLSLDETAMEKVKRYYEPETPKPSMELLMLRLLQLFAEREKIAPPRVTFEGQFQICALFTCPFMRYFEMSYGF